MSALESSVNYKIQFFNTFFIISASVLPVNVVCKDSQSIRLKWESSSSTDSYIVNYEKQGEGVFDKVIQTSENTTDVLTCLDANTTYRVTIKTESELSMFGNSEPFDVTTGR